MKLKVSAFFAAFTCMLAACKNNNNNNEQTHSLPVTNVISKDTFIYTDYISDIHAIQNVEIRARVNGYLEKIFIDEGEQVHAGQLLFTINNKEYLEELAKAKALYKAAVADLDAVNLEYKNVLKLAEKKIVSTTEIALAKSKLDAQKAKMEEALAHQSYINIKLSNTEIRAPFSGIVNRTPQKSGSLIEEGTLLTTISNSNQVFAYFDVSEKEYLRYARNLKSDSLESNTVTLILADGMEHNYKGQIETIEGIIDESTGNIAFRARFPNPDRIIKHGASGTVRLVKQFNDILIVPQKSTFEIQDKLYVYVVDEQNNLQQRNIGYVARLPHVFLVNNGIKAGERILFEGIQNVKPNMTIKPELHHMSELLQGVSVK
jgi:RND family efflux transporter MFP subunit